MRSISDESGRGWIATAQEEETPRHHGRWHLAFRPEGEEGSALVLPEVLWKTRETAERTILHMSEIELRRRLNVARERFPAVAHRPA